MYLQVFIVFEENNLQKEFPKVSYDSIVTYVYFLKVKVVNHGVLHIVGA